MIVGDFSPALIYALCRAAGGWALPALDARCVSCHKRHKRHSCHKGHERAIPLSFRQPCRSPSLWPQHGQTPCESCSKVTGQSYSNATKNLYDYVAKWANARFK
jgi:hypothetical protein